MTITLFLLFLLLACLRKMAFGSDVAFNPMFMKGQGCGVREEITTRIVDEISATACDFFTPNKDASKQVLRSVSITSQQLTQSRPARGGQGWLGGGGLVLP